MVESDDKRSFNPETLARADGEKERVDGIIRRDRADDFEDFMRLQAQIEIEDGKFVNLQDTVVPPTREQIAKGEYIPFTPRGRDGTVRSVKGFRKMSQTTVRRMHMKGQISDEGYVACIWYARKYEQAGLEGSIGSVDYGKEVFSSPQTRTAFTEIQQEAQSDLRAAKVYMPKPFVKFFDKVVLEDVPLHRAKRFCRIDSNKVLAKFKDLCETLYCAVKAVDPQYGEKK